jgi:hypothetical protein
MRDIGTASGVNQASDNAPERSPLMWCVCVWVMNVNRRAAGCRLGGDGAAGEDGPEGRVVHDIFGHSDGGQAVGHPRDG